MAPVALMLSDGVEMLPEGSNDVLIVPDEFAGVVV
jgi:hypothetical protein